MKFATTILSLIILLSFFGKQDTYGQNNTIVLAKNQSSSMLEYYALNQIETAWQQDHFNIYFSPTDNIKASEFVTMKKEVEDWVNYWQNQKEKNNKSIVKKIFNKTRNKFLKNYAECSSFSNMLKTGTYDCLTATLLYAHIFNEMGYDFTIKQLNSHVYILLNDEHLGLTLIESTDVYGYVNNEDDIKAREEKYQTRLESSLLYQEYGMNLSENLSIKDLAGLQYYNQAVNAYRTQDLDQAQLSLYKASLVTDSPRIIYLRSYLEEEGLVEDWTK
ncbi:hypothetical protein KMW28_02695 [Flammeovirga yaeyamensis]|uniref:Transglutaminase-like domain-containing protein n=1 Tax=Flammeovirga yaeyamensis TaxID=367791 RepID=A0AAX1N4K9_9BACT|nr:hypothetical protein [Flammeovirga yaeyamensis]MBB3700419.1 hypothetical protein [Flammeovirga yaeyamensis]NMF36955.1 hypothetical protein [Flammeovirga yaeyamensis]QWG02499.1 hypothetical protein KMW28_02695 [Flammeovirga yaeyamensis]